MEYEILYRPSYALAVIKLREGESINAESGAMVSMSEGIQVETHVRGGLFSGLKRTVLGGESFFINTFKASQAGEVTVAPSLPGDLAYHAMDGETLLVQSGSYIASSTEIQVDTKWGGARTFFSREGLFLLKATGRGHLFMSSYGAIHEVSLEAGRKYTVDTGHMVAFQESVQYNVRRSGSWKTTLFGGEGLVVELTGPGRVYMQTRSPDAFLGWIIPKLPFKRE